MTLPLLVANWKANNTLSQALSWVNYVGSKSDKKNTTIIFCPPSIYLAPVKEQVDKKKYKIVLGAQDLSLFDNGPYTGEITANQLAQFCQYVIVGHSERRRNFGETAKIINQKINQALSSKLIPIVCLDDSQKKELLPFKNENIIVAYEPPTAISTAPGAKDQDPKIVQRVAEDFHQIIPHGRVIYGGNINFENIANYLKLPITGVLIGAASLDPDNFLTIVDKIAS